MRKFGLIGRNISYSFSRNYFSEKFLREGISGSYENFDLKNISEFSAVLKENPELRGLNVTIPYKEEIIPFLDSLDPVAAEIGAVNTIKVETSGRLIGYNTDYFGFAEALKPYLQPQHKKALILGTGGASKAIAYALKTLEIEYKFVSRKASEDKLTYEDLNENVLKEYKILVNCSPLGTFPKTEEHPNIPFKHLTQDHLIFDLIYNPPQTRFMELAEEKGATVVNGQKMLEFQAEKAWEIWNR